ncbi:MAG TPA: xanthine dehydrogenase family protein molybdopterin-binding subunit [Geminicoccaceae bacterium]|nr:xanthine dehydrogenase family protein molybdopterin-binding subunit [Geminicoccaceae bacterium]
MAKFGIGQPVTRLEDPRLITGRGRFTDDITLPNQAYAYVLRSPHAHARIVGIDTAAAAEARGVLDVLTGEDVARDGLGDIPCLIPMKNRDGSPRAETPRPLLARERVRHVGDPVACVVAESAVAARDAAELIEVGYEPLPVALGTVEATRGGAPLVWDDAPDNLAFDIEVGDRAAVDAAFAGAAHVVRVELVNNRVVCNAMEPRSAIGDYDPATDRTTLYCGCQGTHLIRDQFADKILKQPRDKVRVLCGDVGGGFGMKAFFFPEYGLVAWAARRLGHPVKWTSERTEGFMSDGQGRDNVTIVELALDADARFLGLRATTYANMGAYLSNFAPIIPTGAGPKMLAGLYRTPAIHVNVKGVLTNTLPVDAYRGAGRPEAAYVIERVVDAAAIRLGLSPDEIRRRNFVPRDGFPYRTPFGDVYDDGDFEGCMDRCMERADWAGFGARRREALRRGKLRGIGMSTYVEVCGGGSPEVAQVVVSDEGRVTILIGTQTNGQGHATAYAQILSEKLGIDAEAIELVQGDSDRTGWGLTGGSRSVPVGGAAILGAADRIIDKAKQIAAHRLETAVADIAFADGRFTVVGTDRSLSLFEVARAAADPAGLPEGMAPGLDETYKRVPEAPTYPNGCHVCEVEVDRDTGAVRIVRYTVVDDFGAVINPLLLTGQVHGGIVQGIGQALHEDTVYDPESGQLLTGSFMDYTMPRADDLTFIDFSMHNVPCRTNPLGIKGSGEAGSIGAPPAVVNAVVDALRPVTGIDHIDMPVTPLKVWRALRRNRAAA